MSVRLRGVFHHRVYIALIVVLGGLLNGCKQPAPPAFTRPPAPVSVVAATAKDVPVYIDRPGRCVAREMVSIQPQVSGRITAIHFKDGEDLKTSQSLFDIDARPYQAQLDAALADLAQRKAVLELAKIEWTRQSYLAKTQAITKEELDTRRNAVDVAVARVSEGDAAVESARLNVEYCSIKSPIEGRAGQRLADVGNVVAANTGSLLTIQRLDPIYADFEVAENDLSAVQKNMADHKLMVEVRLPDTPGETLLRTGELTFVDNAIQEGTGLVKLRATLPNHDHYFWPGRFVKVRLILNTIRNAVLIPASAQQVSATGPYVYVIKPDSTAEMRPIVPGQLQGSMLVVTKGITAEEKVVTAGQMGVSPGGKVHVDDGSSSGTQANAEGTSSTNVSDSKSTSSAVKSEKAGPGQ